MSNRLDFAREELARADLFSQDSPYHGQLGRSVMELLETFSNQGHTAMSAYQVVDLFRRLALYKPLSPITDDPSEWVEIHPNVWQSRRCPHIYKNGDRYLDCSKEFKEIELPYLPE